MTSVLAFSPDEIVDELLDSIAIAIQVGNFMATARARERSIQDCFRNRYRPSVAQQTMMQKRSRSNQSSAHASVLAPPPPPPARVSASAIRSPPQAIVDVDAPGRTESKSTTTLIPPTLRSARSRWSTLKSVEMYWSYHE